MRKSQSLAQAISEDKIAKGRYILIAYRKELQKIRHCQMCKVEFGKGMRKRTIDHKKPLFMGGTSERNNLQAICISCKIQKDKYESKLRKKMLKKEENLETKFQNQ